MRHTSTTSSSTVGTSRMSHKGTREETKESEQEGEELLSNDNTIRCGIATLAALWWLLLRSFLVVHRLR